MNVYALVLAGPDGRLGPYLGRVEGDCDTEMANEVRKTFPPRAETGSGAMMSGSCTEISVLAGLLSPMAGPRNPINAPPAVLQAVLSASVDRPVIDRTGLGGRFVYDMRYASASPQTAVSSAAADPGLPPLAVALEEQLGLRLEPVRGPVDVLVIDSVQAPTEN
jgi:uncharacterized protein (TIGR03435 family)